MVIHDEFTPTYLLTWQPKAWDLEQPEYDARVVITRDTCGFINGYSLGTNFRRIRSGDHVLLYRHGDDGGVVACGVVADDPYPRDEFGKEIDEATNSQWWIEVRWTKWVPLDARLTRDELKRLAPLTFRAPVQASGRGVDASEAGKLWAAFWNTQH
ncbi:MAG: EVE domain-containing protein [Acidimicrobiales bacterium]|uniref:EVE domain-containing protein n=1 Tax=Candidatus Poriferisodalis sp. TaxID=3101277 RepID=UPI0013819376|nr:EVE domain-containing protein [Acidimicrobiales bacterium]MYA75368.1 EVE domain-containing protein [Acidimicrobiaceae bacterium]MXX43925.1 EVE domain-containing protein [Acidimicrobiales bacterium]MYG89480.1 EVE domain-containing protein [Acidimicrobiales bacterium]MYI08315.1 EVE domain-containing protein [Acidimicrobiales bacterium]